MFAYVQVLVEEVVVAKFGLDHVFNVDNIRVESYNLVCCGRREEWEATVTFDPYTTHPVAVEYVCRLDEHGQLVVRSNPSQVSEVDAQVAAVLRAFIEEHQDRLDNADREIFESLAGDEFGDIVSSALDD